MLTSVAVFLGALFMRVIPIILGLMMLASAQAASPVNLLSLETVSDDTLGEDAPRAQAVDFLELEFVITPGEYEPASLVLAATENVKQLELSVSDFRDTQGNIQAGAELDIRIVKRWYQKQFGAYTPKNLRNLTSELLVYDDTLIRVSDGHNSLKLADGTYVDISKEAKNRKPVTPSPAEFPVRDAAALLPLDLAAGERRQFWFTLYVAPDVPAGSYQAAVNVQVGDTVYHSIPIAVEVLPFTLAESLLEYSIYYRGVLDKDHPEGSISSEYKSKSQMLADLQNMRAHGITNPTVYQKLSSGLLDDVLELRQQAGFYVDKLYFLGVNMVQNDNGHVRPSLTYEVEKTLKIAREYGIKDVYFYARDEGRGEELLYQQPFWDAVKNAGGKVMAAGWQDTFNKPGNFTVLGGKEDLYVVLGTLEVAEAERWHSKGKLIYSYHNPLGGKELPATWRRNYGLLLWQAGYDGAMPYAWQHSFGFAWNDFDHFRHRDSFAAYPSAGGPIDTMQWEGFREGIDDVRYLSTLLNMLDTAAYRKSPYYNPALDWVEQLRAMSLGQANLDQLRAEMVGYILALLDWNEAGEDLPVISSLQVSPVEPDMSATVTWHSSIRSDASVKIGSTKYNSVPRMKNHELKLGNLKPAKTQMLEVSNQAAISQQSVLNSLELSTEEEFSLTEVSGSVAGDSLRVSFIPKSEYRGSVAVVPGKSLLGWWRFSGSDSEAQDSSGQKHTAELKGGAERTDGWFGRGVNLDGEGAFVHFPDIEVAENGTASVEGWYRFRSFAMDEVENKGLFSGLYQHANNNHFYFSRTNDHFEVGSLLSRNVWHHIVVIWNGDVSSATCYVDGERVGITVQADAEEIQKISGLNIGRSSNYLGGLVGSATNTFDGDVDEVRVWNRVLSYAEVQASFRSGRERLTLDLPVGTDQNWKVIGATAADQQAIVER
jgi:hypothetical protein